MIPLMIMHLVFALHFQSTNASGAHAELINEAGEFIPLEQGEDGILRAPEDLPPGLYEIDTRLRPNGRAADPQRAPTASPQARTSPAPRSLG